ncbi:MAG: biotin-dependent carboxyltransferase family protein, partial [Spirochaetales bacterium]|nr:biotin-dependent carboxyltransferase family protein [Spirochaetales bacterium]
SHYAKAGDLLAGGFMTGGLRGYLSIAGGIDVPVIMGSRSTNLRGKFGGCQGRELKKDDVLETGNAAGTLRPRALKAEYIPRYGNEIDVRVIPGPQDEAVTEAGMNAFLSSPYKVSFDSDRMGIRLAGEKIEHVKAADIISDGIAFGSVQAPGDGQPIIMLAERQTTGGYCKIATAITADRSKLAQARPKCLIRFHKVSLEESLEALKEYRSFFDRLEEYCPAL